MNNLEKIALVFVAGFCLGHSPFFFVLALTQGVALEKAAFLLLACACIIAGVFSINKLFAYYV